MQPLWAITSGGNSVCRLAFILLIAGVFISVPALADALVEVKSDQISVNRDGRGFRQVAGITEAKPDDLVMASDGGHGWIIYPDCDVEVLPGKVYTVEDRPGEIRDPKEFRPMCKKPVPYLFLGATAAVIGVEICAAAGCFDDPASP